MLHLKNNKIFQRFFVLLLCASLLLNIFTPLVLANETNASNSATTVTEEISASHSAKTASSETQTTSTQQKEAENEVFSIEQKVEPKKATQNTQETESTPELVQVKRKTPVYKKIVRDVAVTLKIREYDDFQKDLEIQVKDVHGNNYDNIEVSAIDSDTISVKQKENTIAKPGKYILEIDSDQGEYTEEFIWGVIAFNSDKSVYKPQETAQFQFAVLDENGHMACDAPLSATITEPDGSTTELSVSDGSISVGVDCKKYSYTREPDFFAEYATEKKGEYIVSVSTVLNGESYSIEDSFEVSDSYPAQIRRNADTRIYPPLDYPVQIHLEFLESFSGKVIERVPKEFTITPSDSYTIETTDTEHKIIWELSAEANETQSLNYTYKAPNKSPALYTVGPLELITDSEENFFTEQRKWQIAGDAIGLTVQSGQTSISASTTATTSISPVNATGNAFILHSYRGSDSGAQNLQEIYSTATFNSTSEIQFERASSSGSNNISWYVVEATNGEFSVERGSISFGTSDTSLTATIPDIGSTSNAMILVDGFANIDDPTDQMFTASFNSTTEIAVSRSGSGTAATAEYQVIVWNNEVTVQKGTTTMSSSSSESASISAVDLSKTAVFTTKACTNNGLAQVSPRAWLSSTTQINFDRTTSTGTCTINWAVVEFPDGVTVQSDNNTSSPATNQLLQQVTLGTDVDLSHSFSVTTNKITGTGTAFPRPQTTNFLTDVNLLELRTGYNGQTNTWTYYVIDTSGWVPAGAPITQQLHFRWRDDTTDLNTSGGWLAAEDSNTIGTVTRDESIRIRFGIANIGTATEASARQYQIQYGNQTGYGTCGAIPSWTNVGSSGAFNRSASSHITNQESTSALLANSEGYTFVAGSGQDSSAVSVSIGPLESTEYTEIEYSIEPTENAVTGEIYCFRLYDSANSESLNSYDRYPKARLDYESLATPTLEWGTQTNVSDTGWTTVNFSGTYTDPVFVCTVQYDNNIGNEVDGTADSVVCRVQNVAGSSAQVRLQEAGETSGTLANSETIHWMVAETGTYDTNDIKFEAFTYNSTVTDENGGYTGQSQSYSQSYTSPVVIGQVMTYNDTNWSTFYAKGSASDNSIPDSSSLITGKHVGEDTNVTRSDETIGVIVFETDHNTVNNIEYEAAVTAQNIVRIDAGSTNHTLTSGFSATPEVALLGQAGINGADGPHPVLYGSTPFTSSTITMAIHEDEIADTEMSGNDEAVGYIVFEEPGAYNLNDIAFDQTTYRFYENTDAVQPTTALSTEDTSVSDISNTEVVRIRTAVQIGINDLPSDLVAFKLQYAQATDCSAASGWTDAGAISSGSIFRGYNNATPTDGTTLSSSLLNAQSNTLMSYEEENNSVVNPSLVSRGDRAEWDWVIQNNGAATNTRYCFRMVTSDNELLHYTQYPQLTTENTSGLTNAQLMRHGGGFSSQGSRSTFTF